MESKQNIPSLRFSEFEEKWSTKKLIELGKILGGGTPSTKNIDFWNGSVPWVSSSDVIDESIYKINTTRFITINAINESATKIIPKKSVLIVSRVGVGKVAVNEEELCTSQDFTNLIPDSDNYIFLAYQLKIKTNKLLEFNQGTSIKGFVKSDLEGLELNLPLIKEQTKIAKFLTSVDEKLQALKQKKTLLEQYKKGVMQKIFSQELRFKDDNGNDFENWEDTTVGEVVEFRNGKAHENDIDVNGKFIVVNSKFISQNGNVRKYSNECIMPLYKEDIVMVMSDVPNGKALAKCFLIDENDRFTLNQRICALKGKKCYNPFLIFLINRNEYYLSFNSGVGQTNLKKEDVLNCPLFIPASIVEQTKIANFLSTIDDKINHCQSQIEKMDVWKKGLLQQMFC